MNQDERQAAQAAVDEMTISINAIVKALMLDPKDFPNAIVNQLMNADKAIVRAKSWLDRIDQGKY